MSTKGLRKQNCHLVNELQNDEEKNWTFSESNFQRFANLFISKVSLTYCMQGVIAYIFIDLR